LLFYRFNAFALCPTFTPVPLLEIKDLTLDFVSGGQSLRTLDGVSLTVEAGETLCLVGESGCGKSLTALSIARLVPSPPARYAGGEIRLNGRDVLRLDPAALREVRGGVVSYVFQEPGASLNPVYRVGRQVKESLELHRPRKATESEVIRLLSLVGIPAPESRMRDFPFQLSGGMQQRVMLAMALACEPQLLVADEPTTALDVTIQAQILELFRALQARLGMAILLITHNLGIVGEVGDRVAVMYAGEIVEVAPARELLRSPLHPYTRALLNSVPRLHDAAGRLAAIPGTVPRPGAMPPGCRFGPRCPYRRPECVRARPELRELGGGRFVRCPYAESLPDSGPATINPELHRS
jgi:oligopeptide/dipeptide ABC transporter ATP-binding protein